MSATAIHAAASHAVGILPNFRFEGPGGIRALRAMPVIARTPSGLDAPVRQGSVGSTAATANGQ